MAADSEILDGVHHQGAEHTKTWGLPFPFLVTHILRKKGIKGDSTDGPIIESPYFGTIQWCQSLSHMPRAAPQPEPAPVPEPMDVPEMAVEPEFATEKEEQPDEREEYEDGIMIRRSNLLHFQETLVDIRSQIADLQRDARQDRLEVQEMFRAIMDRLPPTAGPSAPPPAP
jgi:hypothetical protein